MSKETRTPKATAETVSALEAARRSLVLQDDDGTRFVCLLGPFLPVRVPPDRAAEDWFLRERIRRRDWMWALVALLYFGGLLLLPLSESAIPYVVYNLALYLALVAWRWKRVLVSMKGWSSRPRLSPSHWYRLAFRQRAYNFGDRQQVFEFMPLVPACLLVADGRFGLGLLLVFLLQPEMILRTLLDLSLLAGRLVPAARRTC